MNSNNEPEVYDISGDTFTQLQDYLKKITDKHIEFYSEMAGIVEAPECLYLKEDYYKISFNLYDRLNNGNELVSKAVNLDNSNFLLKINGFLIDFNGKKFRFKIETNAV